AAFELADRAYAQPGPAGQLLLGEPGGQAASAQDHGEPDTRRPGLMIRVRKHVPEGYSPVVHRRKSSVGRATVIDALSGPKPGQSLDRNLISTSVTRPVSRPSRLAWRPAAASSGSAARGGGAAAAAPTSSSRRASSSTRAGADRGPRSRPGSPRPS